MISAPLPRDEEGRLEALKALEILDTPGEPAFDSLVQLAAQICHVPIALVSLVDARRQWFKASVGLSVAETPRDIAFCSHAILSDELFIVGDAASDVRFSDNPLVHEEPRIRFYAGAPLRGPTGHILGTLCVLDRKPRQLDATQLEALRTLGRAAAAQLELRFHLKESRAVANERARALASLQRSERLLGELTCIQSDVLLGGEATQIFERMLAIILRETESQYGFVGEVLLDPTGQRYLRTHALTDISWDELTRKLYEDNVAKGLEFRNLKTLFGEVLRTGAPVISNDPGADPRSGGLPPGHPPLNSFLGLPTGLGAEMVGMVGVANRQGGYSEQSILMFQPLIAICTSVISSYRNVRLRAEAELALRESEERYRQVLSTSLDAVVGTDIGGRVVAWNPQAEAIFGWSAAEVMGRSLTELIIPEEYREGHRRGMIRYASTGESRVIGKRLELSALRRSGEVFPVELTLAAIPGSNGPEFSAFIRDISNRKKAERDLAARGNELSFANAELARGARLKDEFLASMSHELRTPLHSVLGLAEAVRIGVYGEVQPEQEEPLKDIEASGQHLLQLINDILDLSKVEAGRLSVAPVGLDPEIAVGKSLRIVRELAQGKRLHVSSSVAPGIGNVLADPLRLNQVLVNLLSNAVKFTPEGGRIGLDVTTVAESGAIRFCVWDTGIGIAESDFGSLFKPFIQLDAGLSREHAGTGLGLALVQRLTEMHGGGVEVQSVVGRGSRFSVIFPNSGDELPDESKTVQQLTSAPLSLTVESKIGSCILLIEDQELNIRTLQPFLKSQGFRVIVARSGIEGLEVTKRISPDLILMDIQMPEMDGIETTRRMRMESGTAHVPIVALTALALPGDRERCLAAGANAYICKPIGLALLLSTIREFI